tara:strand:+ start:434 stop:703 length:270 start_codon:yes stop_codon:yes gene_type:complete
MDIDCRELWKKYGPDAFGWSGSLAILIAYGFATYQDEEDVEPHRRALALTNMYGSSAIGYVCYRGKVWQAFMLEMAWFGIALTSLLGTI